MPVVGSSVPRIDAVSKVSGEALFPGDFQLPNQAMMKVLFARRPHARITQLDTSRAEQFPGVLMVLTAKDVPVNEYGLTVPDQPVLCGPGSNKPYADHVRFIGDQIALVIAETEEIAEEAIKLIEVAYEDLPLVLDPVAAMQDTSPLLHPDRGSNVFCHYRIRKGDTDEAMQQADVIVEGEYQTPVQEHAFLQPEAGIAYVDDDGVVTLVVGGQWAHEDQEQICHALNLPPDLVRVIYPAIGGAFGGREDMSVQIILCLAALKLHERGFSRPVKIVWSREESIIGHHKRHAYRFRCRWGANKSGKIIAAEVEVIADGGAYMYTSTKVLGNATLMCTGPYEIPNIKVDSYAVYTNHIPGGAFRGFGGPQGTFAAESQIAKLAEKLGMDPVEIRARNVLQEGSLLSVGTPLPKGVTIGEVVSKCAKEAGWRKSPENGWIRPISFQRDVPGKPYLKRGLGFACSFKNVGFSFGGAEQCTATVELQGEGDIEQAVVYHAAADVGQGTHTVIAQMAAEALGIPYEKVRMVTSDTAHTGNSGSVSASRMTFMAGNAVRGAAALAMEKWSAEERPAVATYQYRPPKTTPYDPETGKCEPNFAYGYVAESAEVEVDFETGQVRIVKVICADDVGRAINPDQVSGQIEGAIVQAGGYAILENFVEENGKVLTTGLSTYLIPTILDIPEVVQPIILEYPDPIGPFGARGMGEMPYLAMVPAITAAVKDATGLWMDEFPLTPERVLDALEESGLI